MNRQLFRDEASLQLRSKLSNSLEHQALKRPSGLLVLLGTSLLVVAVLSFVPVSLGVTAPGVLRLTGGSQPVVAERSGVLTYVLSEREQSFVGAGTVLASIRNLDLAASRNAPNSEFALRELAERRERLELRLAELEAQRTSQEEGFASIQTSLGELIENLDELIALYEQDIARLTSDLEVKETALTAGNIRGPEVEAVRNLLRDREVQLRESQIRQGEIRGQLATLDLERSKAVEAASQETLQLEDQRSEVEQSIQTESEIAPISLTMPADGLLVPRGFKTGQTVNAGDILFDTVGDDGTYLFEVDVPAAQIGELHEGLPVRVALTAYPYFEYGFLDGTVKQMTHAPNKPIDFSQDLPVNSQFRVIIEPDQRSFEAFSRNKTLVPGMSATVHIRKEKVALWRLVLAPLLRFEARI